MAFDWQILQDIRAHLPASWVLSGGLDATTVEEAVRSLAPPAVDVSSGVERLVDGKPRSGGEGLESNASICQCRGESRRPKER